MHCTCTHIGCYFIGSSLALTHTHIGCYVVGSSLALAHTLDATWCYFIGSSPAMVVPTGSRGSRVAGTQVFDRTWDRMKTCSPLAHEIFLSGSWMYSAQQLPTKICVLLYQQQKGGQLALLMRTKQMWIADWDMIKFKLSKQMKTPQVHRRRNHVFYHPLMGILGIVYDIGFPTLPNGLSENGTPPSPMDFQAILGAYSTFRHATFCDTMRFWCYHDVSVGPLSLSLSLSIHIHVISFYDI